MNCKLWVIRFTIFRVPKSQKIFSNLLATLDDSLPRYQLLSNFEPGNNIFSWEAATEMKN